MKLHLRQLGDRLRHVWQELNRDRLAEAQLAAMIAAVEASLCEQEQREEKQALRAARHVMVQSVIDSAQRALAMLGDTEQWHCITCEYVWFGGRKHHADMPPRAWFAWYAMKEMRMQTQPMAFHRVGLNQRFHDGIHRSRHGEAMYEVFVKDEPTRATIIEQVGYDNQRRVGGKQCFAPFAVVYLWEEDHASARG